MPRDALMLALMLATTYLSLYYPHMCPYTTYISVLEKKKHSRRAVPLTCSLFLSLSHAFSKEDSTASHLKIFLHRIFFLYL
jgi:hypothetical protein